MNDAYYSINLVEGVMSYESVLPDVFIFFQKAICTRVFVARPDADLLQNNGLFRHFGKTRTGLVGVVVSWEGLEMGWKTQTKQKYHAGKGRNFEWRGNFECALHLLTIFRRFDNLGILRMNLQILIKFLSKSASKCNE